MFFEYIETVETNLNYTVQYYHTSSLFTGIQVEVQFPELIKVRTRAPNANYPAANGEPLLKRSSSHSHSFTVCNDCLSGLQTATVVMLLPRLGTIFKWRYLPIRFCG